MPVLISDMADVNTGFQQRQGMVGMDAKDDIVNGTILMRKGENPSVVLEGVKAKIDELNKSILPKGVQLVPYYDRAWLIDNTLQTVFKNLGGRRAAGLSRAVPLPGEIPAGGDRGGRHSAGAARDVHRPEDQRHSGEPAFARRDGLRHHRGWRGDRRREYLPPRLARSSIRIGRSKKWWRKRRPRWAGRRSSRC